MKKKTLIATAAALVIGAGAATLQPAPAQAGGFSLQIGNAGFGFSIHDRHRHGWRHHRKVRRFHGRRHCFIRHRKVMVRKWNRWRGCWEWRRVHRRVLPLILPARVPARRLRYIPPPLRAAVRAGATAARPAWRRRAGAGFPP